MMNRRAFSATVAALSVALGFAAAPSGAAETAPQGAQRHDPVNPLWGVFGPDPRTADLSRSGDLLTALADWLAESVSEQLASGT